MRIFTALALSAEGQDLLYRQTEHLREVFPRLKWVEKDSLHITLEFIGEVSDKAAAAAAAALESAVLDIPSFTITVRGRGTFPRKGQARVVYARIREGQQECKRIYSEVSGRREREYLPHITLARVRRGVRWPSSGDNRSVPSGTVSVDRVVLFQSLPGPSGARYVKLAEKKLKTS